MTQTKYGKCYCCGDMGNLLLYNSNYSCNKCLSMDERGIPRKIILDKIGGKENYGKLRRNRKKHR